MEHTIYSYLDTQNIEYNLSKQYINDLFIELR